MKRIVCENCGGNHFVEHVGYRFCAYCNTCYVIQGVDLPSGNSPMTINEDIANLLRKCHEDPAKAHRYANLILDIDPSNKEALKFL